MKRSRIILGMAALCVAAFGAFAFTEKSMSTNAEYIRPSDNQCVPITVQDNCPAGNPTCKIPPGHDDAGEQLFQENSNCSVTLQKEAGF